MEQIRLITLLQKIHSLTNIQVWVRGLDIIYEGDSKDFPFEYFDYLNNFVEEIRVNIDLLEIVVLSNEESNNLFKKIIEE